ncbi:MAG TPA: saccharopine dehydrogenase, partial [Hyphomonas atlantica]|nr:saccharopine dehydrogenase [Hyphomonas atlantica]
SPPGSGRMRERFGLLSFTIALGVNDTHLAYPVVSARLLGAPLPPFLRPRSTTRETVDAQGRACFDVRIDLPLGGHVATYTGWLEPND